jgi:hypothetical protein
VTPFGGAAVFITYLQKIGLVEQVRHHRLSCKSSAKRYGP